MVSARRRPGFCLNPTCPAPGLASSQFTPRAVSPRKNRHMLSTAISFKAKGPVSMSLANELIVKGLEVGVATYLGNAVAVQQKSPPPPTPERGLFRSRRKKSRSKPNRAASTGQLDSDQVRGMVTEVMRLAEGLPEVLERGGPEGKKWVKLAICIGIDLVGSGSLGVPLIGDALDLVTAPLSAVMLQALFGNTLITMGGLAEELLPGTDGIPTATLAWLAEYYGYLNPGKDGEAR